MNAPLDLILLVFLIITAIAALEAADLLIAVILFGAFSFFSATFYALVGALDVAFTEIALGAVVATVFFVSAIRRSSKESGRRTR